ncbi:hypothetical protein GCM10008957_38340 [Deinococcus ruber]|uniref:PBP domain-containing protein n=1 Tax=Deinococcus ruber TaxID=1848197 RepID=A0A918CGG0_9DEIO|nr:hypothetical protein GCM10008957_38340 [Deinococcus ruber]
MLAGSSRAAPLSPVPPPSPPIPLLSLPEAPLQVVGSTPTWAGTAVFANLPPQDAAAELYAGRADVVLGTLPLPAPPAGIDAPVAVPVGVFAVSVVYQLPGVALRLDIPALCALLGGQISVWNAPALHALNPGVTLPALPVLLSARVARNGVSLAVAGSCVKAGIWPASQLKSNWTARTAFARATLGAQKSDLNIPGALALFSPLDVPPGAQVALLRSPGGTFVPPRSELGLSGPRLPGAPPLLPLDPFGALHATDAVGAYPLRGLIWASVLPHQAYRGRTVQRAQQILSLLDALRGSTGHGLAGLPLNAWSSVRLRYGSALVVPAISPP